MDGSVVLLKTEKSEICLKDADYVTHRCPVTILDGNNLRCESFQKQTKNGKSDIKHNSTTVNEKRREEHGRGSTRGLSEHQTMRFCRNPVPFFNWF